MLTELGQDTAEITAVLDEGIREENARRIRFLGLIGAAGLAYISAEAFVKHMPTLIPWDRIATGMPGESLPAWLRLDGAGLKDAGTFAFALAVSALAGWVAWVKTRRPEFRQEGSELQDRAVEEIVLDSLERR